MAGCANALGDPGTARPDALTVDAADSAFSVLNGVTLNSARGITINASGFRLRAVVDPITVAYDPVTQTVTPAALSRFSLEPGRTQPIGLSAAIPLPSHTNLEWEVLTLAAGLDEVTAETFEDVTEKTWGLPRTSLRVERGDDGVQHVHLAARPVVTTLEDIPKVGINGETNDWSDLRMPHAGADYLITNNVGRIDHYAFGGDNLTIANDVQLQFKYANGSACGMFRTQSGNPVVVYPGVRTVTTYENKDLYADGAIELVGDYGDGGCFDCLENYKSDRTGETWGTFDLRATLSGAGTLKLSGKKNCGSWNGLSGSNTNYFGRIIMTGGETTLETRGVQVGVSKTESLGGRLDEFADDFVVDRAPGYVCRLVTTALEGGCTRFSLKCEKAGFVLLFR